METWVASIPNFGLRIADVPLEKAPVLQGLAHQFHIIFEVGGIVGFGKKIFEKDGVWYADRLHEMHGLAQLTALHVLIADKFDTSDLNLRPFAHNKCESNRCWRYWPDFGADGGELVAMFGFQVPDYDFGLLNFGGIVLRLWRERNFVLLESIENVAFGDGIDAEIVDLSHPRLLFNINMQDPALGRGLALEANILEIAGIPQRVEIALDGRLIVYISRTREDVGTDGFCRNAT